jgi:ornithine carbamoyltransferase
LTFIKAAPAALATLAEPMLTDPAPAAMPASRRSSPPPGAAAALPPPDAQALLEAARGLRRAALDGLVHLPLKGRNLGLLTAADGSPEASLFTAAASALGARVVRLPPQPWGGADPAPGRDAARLLGRLYDAIECQGLPAEQVAWLGRHSGVPVFDTLAGETHPTASLAQMLDGGSADPLNRRCVLQAALLGAVSGA